MAKKKTDQKIKIHMPELVPTALLKLHTTNSNKQSKHVMKKTRENIAKHGFDEPIIVRPTGDGFYEIVAGNHRFLAGKAEGMDEFPCVIREDWDKVEAEIQSVLRNYSRGQIDKDAFTLQVNKLAAETGMLMGDIMEQMGFEDSDKFAAYYKEEKEREERVAEATVSAPAVKMLDELGLVLSAIYEKYGDTAPCSFIFFPAGQRTHLFIAANPGLKRTIEQIATRCVQENLDINIALAGLLAVGMANSNFIMSTDKVAKAGVEEGSSDLEGVKK